MYESNNLETYCTTAPTEKATKTESKIPPIICVALVTLIYSASILASPPVAKILINETATAAPNSSNTIETVVDVGIPRVLKKSSNNMSVIITAINMIIISEKKNISGLKIPFLATSIIPLEKTAPTATPKLAKIIIFLTEIAFDPKAEFKKFTASLLTPTTKSPMARIARAIIIIKYISMSLLN